MKVFCCQLDIVWEDKKANFAKVRRQLASQVIPKGSLIVLPEMFATGFSMDVAAIAEAPGGPTDVFLSDLSRVHGVFVIAGLVGRASGAKGLNQSVVFSPAGKELARYTKMQPFSLGGETTHYQAGDEPRFFCWQEMVTAPFICYDLRFPELFRTGVRGGAQLFSVIASWPVIRIQHWVTLLQARAIENQAYFVGVNRCGTDPRFTYNGRSMIVDPHGEILADAGADEGVISAEVDVAAVTSWRAEFPAVRDMRP